MERKAQRGDVKVKKSLILLFFLITLIGVAQSYNIVNVYSCEDIQNNFASNTYFVFQNDVEIEESACLQIYEYSSNYENIVFDLNKHKMYNNAEYIYMYFFDLNAKYISNMTIKNGEIEKLILHFGDTTLQYITFENLVMNSFYVIVGEGGISDVYFNNITAYEPEYTYLLIHTGATTSFKNLVFSNVYIEGCIVGDTGLGDEIILENVSGNYCIYPNGYARYYLRNSTLPTYEVIGTGTTFIVQDKLKIKSKDDKGNNIPSYIEIIGLNEDGKYFKNPDKKIKYGVYGEDEIYVTYRVYGRGYDDTEYDYSYKNYKVIAKSGNKQQTKYVTFNSPAEVEFIFTTEQGEPKPIETGLISLIPLVVVLGIIAFIFSIIERFILKGG